MADDGQRTEQPSPRKLKKAREQGQFLVSRAFVNGAQFAAFVTMAAWYGDQVQLYLANMMRTALKGAFTFEASPAALQTLLIQLLWPGLSLFALCGGVLLATSIAFQLAMTQLGVSTHGLTPQFSRLSPLTKIKSIKEQNFPDALQAMIMLPLFLGIVWMVAQQTYTEFLTIPLGSVAAGSQRINGTVRALLWKGAFAFLIFGVIDYVRQRQKYTNKLKMSKQEVKDEYKETEGNPQLKARIRRIQRDASRRNMMKAVPTATAVVVNPTHFAVAIEYRMEEMTAPKVVAKGKNYLALRIRKRAEEHGVPIVENPPLAQALYKSADVGQEIPPHLYRAVAEVLAYIFRLMNQRSR
jgi:flagellar biosynthesis protein FlhB